MSLFNCPKCNVVLNFRNYAQCWDVNKSQQRQYIQCLHCDHEFYIVCDWNPRVMVIDDDTD